MTGADGRFDAGVAATYDTDPANGAPKATGPMVRRLAALADGGPALEFAIGTGRGALPLQDAGVKVAGIDLSRAMVDRLRAKPGGAAIEVAIGDMTATRVAGYFSLVFLVFNTIDNLKTQDAQVACFANAARHLSPGGAFVVETGVPPLRRLPPGETRLAFARSDRHWGIDEIDTATQTYTSHHAVRGPDGMRLTSVPFRYAWPAEMDLMARMAGLTLDARWADWTGAAFDADSRSHVSAWRRPQADA